MATETNKVMEYTSNSIQVNKPGNTNTKAVVYVRPGDTINFNFDIHAVKVDVIKGDVHIVFSNGSTVTLVSLAALSFSNEAPVLTDISNEKYTLDDFLTKTEVLDYNEAVLILSNRDEVKLVEEVAKVVKQASDNEDDLVAGTPVSGEGGSNSPTQGDPSTFIDPQGISTTANSYNGNGSFVSTIYTSNYPFALDKDKNQPGQVSNTKEPSITTKVFYGSSLEKSNDVDMNGNRYTTYKYHSGMATVEDSSSILVPNKVEDYSTNNHGVFVNNNTDAGLGYVLEVTYGAGTIFPNQVSVTLPSSVAKLVTLKGIDTAFRDPTVNIDGSVTYTFSELDPSGKSTFLINVPQGMSATNFNLQYEMKYNNATTGQIDTAQINYPLVIYPVQAAGDLTINGTDSVLSSSPNPVDVKTGNGDDIIIGGGAGNIVSSSGGNDKVFTGVGSDQIEVGSGSNEVWGSTGSDLIQASGQIGNNTIYYNNQRVSIDDTDKNFKDAYFDTNKGVISLTSYLGYDAANLKNKVSVNASTDPDGAVSKRILAAVKDGSILISKSNNQGTDIVNGFNTVYLSENSDTVYISDKIQMSYDIYSGYRGKDSGNALSSYTLHLDDKLFTGKSKIDIAAGKVYSGNNMLAQFHDFSVFEGRVGQDDYFVAGMSKNYISLTIDAHTAGKNGNTIDYSQMDAGIVFKAAASLSAASVVTKGEMQNQVDNIKNISNIMGSTHDDTFYSSMGLAFTFTGNGGNDTVSYSLVDGSGVTYDVDKECVYKTVGAIDDKTLKDTLIDIDHIVLSNSNDIILANDKGGHDFDGAGGTDTLSYEKVTSGGITLTMHFDSDLAKNYGYAEITLANGNKDTFNISNSTVSFSNNIAIVKGTDAKDVFYLGAGPDSLVMTFDGVDGKEDVVSYEQLDVKDGGAGVTFHIRGGVSDADKSYVTKGQGSTDYFTNIPSLVGSKGDDIVSFASSITTLSQITSYNYDLLDGNNSVDFSAIVDSLVDTGGKGSNVVQISFNTDGQMEVHFGYKDSDGSFKEIDSNTFLTFDHVASAVGSAYDDFFVASDTIASSYNGSKGDDTADYSKVTKNTVFDMTLLEDNVSKGGTTEKDENGNTIINTDDAIKDTLSGVSIIKGGQGNNIFYLNANVSYSLIGSEKTDEDSNVLSYEKITTSVTVDFKNSTVTKLSGFEDTFANITKVIGSRGSDNFLAYEAEDGKGVTHHLYGGVSDTEKNTLNFSSFENEANALNIELVDDSKAPVTLVVANMTWVLDKYINGFVGTKFDDTFVVNGYNHSLTIDGGVINDDSNNTVDYTKDTTSSDMTLLLGETSSLTRTAASGTYTDNLTNINTILLSDKDDEVTINTGIDKSTIKVVDAGGSESIFGNTLKFNKMGSDISVDIGAAGVFSLKGVAENITLKNFHEISLGTNTSTVDFSQADYGDTALAVSANSSDNGGNTTVTFSGAGTTGITLKLNDSTAENAEGSIDGGIKISKVHFSGISAFVFSGGDNTVYANTFINAAYSGVEGSNNSITYESMPASKKGVTIDLSNLSISKNISSGVQKDTFDSTFTKITGSVSADTVLLTSFDIPDSVKNLVIDLKPAGSADTEQDIVEVNIDKTPIIYDWSSSKITDGGDKSIDLSHITGAKALQLSGTEDTVLLNTKITDSNNLYSTIRGGGDKNVIDATDLGAGGLIFDVKTGAVSTNTASFDATTRYSDIKWDDVKFAGFNTVKGAKDSTNAFYSYKSLAYNFVGGENSTNIINYDNLTLAINVDIVNNTVIKGAGDNAISDTFSNIQTIVGSNYADTFEISDFSKLGSLSIIANANGATDVGDILRFSAPDSVTFVLDTDKTSISAGGKNYDVDIKGVNVYEFTKSSGNIFSVAGDVAYSVQVTATATDGNALTALYSINSDVTFENTRSINISRTVGSDKFHDIYYGLTAFEYSGTGTATVQGSVEGFSFIGHDENKSFVIDYSAISAGTGLKVTFKADADGFFTVEKTGIEQATNDRFKDITDIYGTTKTDTYEVSDTLTRVITIHGSGSDKVSFNLLFADGHDFQASDLTGDGLKDQGYILDGINSFGLTDKDDSVTFSDDDFVSKNFIIDGLKGENKFDYGNITKGSISVIFSSVSGEDRNASVQKSVDGSAKVYQDQLLNISTIVGTSTGVDTFKLGTSIVNLSIEEKTTDNIISFEKVSAHLNIDFKNSNLTVTEGDTEKSFSGFSNITVSKDSELHYSEISSDVVTFTAPVSATNALFYLGAALDKAYVSYTGSTMAIYQDDALSKQIISLISFTGIVAENDTKALIIDKTGTDYGKFTGAAGTDDTITYHDSQDMTLSITSDTDATYSLSGSTSDTEKDVLKSIEHFNMGDGTNTVELFYFAEGTPAKYFIDGGNSGSNTVSLKNGYTNAVNIDFTAGGDLNTVLAGYQLTNFTNYTLTDKADTVIVDSDNAYVINGGDGDDTLDYSKLDKSVTMTFDGNTSELLVSKTTSAGKMVSDTMTSFEIINMANVDSNSFSFAGGDTPSADSQSYTINMGTGKNNTALFSDASVGGTFSFDGSDIIADFGKAGKFTLSGVTNFAATNKDDTFELSQDNYGDLIIDGAGGDNNALKFNSSVTTDMYFGIATTGKVSQLTDGAAGDTVVGFKSINVFTGGAGLNVFSLGVLDADGTLASFVVDGGNSDKENAVTYNEVSLSTILYMQIGKDNILVDKSGGDTANFDDKNTSMDKLSNISKITGGAGRTDFSIKESGKYTNNTLTIVGVDSALGNSSISFTDFSNKDSQLVITYSAVDVTKATNHFTASLDGVTYDVSDVAEILLKENTQINISTDVSFASVSGGQVFKSVDTNSSIILSNATDTSAAAVVDLSNNKVSYTTADGGLSTFNIDGTFNIYEGGAVDKDGNTIEGKSLLGTTIIISNLADVKSNVNLATITSEDVVNKLDLSNLSLGDTAINATTAYRLDLILNDTGVHDFNATLYNADGSTELSSISHISTVVLPSKLDAVINADIGYDNSSGINIAAGLTSNQTLNLNITSTTAAQLQFEVSDKGFKVAESLFSQFTLIKLGQIAQSTNTSLADSQINLVISSIAAFSRLTEIDVDQASSSSVSHLLDFSNVSVSVNISFNTDSMIQVTSNNSSFSSTGFNSVSLSSIAYNIIIADGVKDVSIIDDNYGADAIRNTYTINNTASVSSLVFSLGEANSDGKSNIVATMGDDTSSIALVNAKVIDFATGVDTVALKISSTDMLDQLNGAFFSTTNTKSIVLTGAWDARSSSVDITADAQVFHLTAGNDSFTYNNSSSSSSVDTIAFYDSYKTDLKFDTSVYSDNKDVLSNIGVNVNVNMDDISKNPITLYLPLVYNGDKFAPLSKQDNTINIVANSDINVNLSALKTPMDNIADSVISDKSGSFNIYHATKVVLDSSSASVTVNLVQSYWDSIYGGAHVGYWDESGDLKELSIYSNQTFISKSYGATFNYINKTAIDHVYSDHIELSRSDGDYGGSWGVYYTNFESVNVVESSVDSDDQGINLFIGSSQMSADNGTKSVNDSQHDTVHYYTATGVNDHISIYSIEDNVVVNTQSVDVNYNKEMITVEGSAVTKYHVVQAEHFVDPVTGKTYDLGENGSYIIFADSNGHQMYVIGANADSIKVPGSAQEDNSLVINTDTSKNELNPVDDHTNSSSNGIHHDQAKSITEAHLEAAYKATHKDDDTSKDDSSKDDTSKDDSSKDDTSKDDTSDKHNVSNHHDNTSDHSLLHSVMTSEDNLDTVFGSHVISAVEQLENISDSLEHSTTTTESEIESSYKMSEENSNDPSSSLLEHLHKHGNNSF